MNQDLNFFSFNELSQEGCFLWVSDSIIDCVGYTADEAIGVSPYTWIHPEDFDNCRAAHQEHVLNELVGTQLAFRMRRKDGTYVPCVVIGCVCYQYIVSCYTFITDGSIQKFAIRGVHTAAMTSLVGSRKEECERISRNHKAFGVGVWNPAGLDLEIRACLLLNRFTRNLCIMYASPSCELIFNFDPNNLLGKPLLLFIRADDLASFVEQSDAARTSATISHLRFWFQSPTCREEIPCEALMYGASDAMILVLRKCLPFRRRRLITGTNPARAKAAHNNLYVAKYGTSGQIYSSHSSSYGGKATYGRHQTSRGIRGDISEVMSSPANFSSPNIASPSDSSYRSTSPSISTRQQYPQSTRDHQARPRHMAVGSIQSILNQDKDPSRLRPLTELVRGDSEEASAPMVQMKQIHSLDAEEEVEAEIVTGIDRINLRSSYRGYIGKDEKDEHYDGDGYSEDDYEDYREGTVVSEEIEEFEMPPSMRRGARY